MDLEEPPDVLRFAQAQLAELQRELPTAVGGTLLLAELNAERITVRPLADLLSGEPPARRRRSQ